MQNDVTVRDLTDNELSWLYYRQAELFSDLAKEVRAEYLRRLGLVIQGENDS